MADFAVIAGFSSQIEGVKPALSTEVPPGVKTSFRPSSTEIIEFERRDPTGAPECAGEVWVHRALN